MVASQPIKLVSQSELQISEADETGLSFIENAILKARHAARCANLPAIADDSGLVVNALKGAPGIYSSRYAGEPSNAAANIKKLLHDMQGVPDEKRDAFFYCVIAFVAHADDPIPLICQGQWVGRILHAPQGKHGFGYDPVFFVPAYNQSAAELDPQLKNKISHRALALQEFMRHLPEKIHHAGTVS